MGGDARAARVCGRGGTIPHLLGLIPDPEPGLETAPLLEPAPNGSIFALIDHFDLKYV